MTVKHTIIKIRKGFDLKVLVNNCEPVNGGVIYVGTTEPPRAHFDWVAHTKQAPPTRSYKHEAPASAFFRKILGAYTRWRVVLVGPCGRRRFWVRHLIEMRSNPASETSQNRPVLSRTTALADGLSWDGE